MRVDVSEEVREIVLNGGNKDSSTMYDTAVTVGKLGIWEDQIPRVIEQLRAALDNRESTKSEVLEVTTSDGVTAPSPQTLNFDCQRCGHVDTAPSTDFVAITSQSSVDWRHEGRRLCNDCAEEIVEALEDYQQENMGDMLADAL